MTLILSIKYGDGVILASDGQATGICSGGPIRQKCQKIYQISENFLIGASGTVGTIQRCRESISSLSEIIAKNGLNAIVTKTTPQNKEINMEARDAIRDQISHINKREIERQKEFYGEVREPPLADIILSFYNSKEDKFRIWHVGPDGGEEFLDELGYGCSGIGDTFAHAYLSNFYREGLSEEQAKLMSYRVIKEAIEIGAYGLGEPIDLWILKRDDSGIKTEQLSQEEMTGLDDSYITWKESEQAVFERLFTNQTE